MQSTIFHTPQQLPPTSPIPSSSPTLLPGSFLSFSSVMSDKNHGPDGLGYNSFGSSSANDAMPPLPTTPHRHGQHNHPRPQLGHLRTGDFTTPTSHSYAPPNSSPLASPRTPTRSSVQQQQQHQRMGVKTFASAGNLERRKSAYKARVSVRSISSSDERSRNPFLVGGGGASPGGSSSGASFSLGASAGSQAQKEFLRRQFQQNCLQRAARARERAVQHERGGSVKKDASFSSDYYSGSSDGFDEEMMGVGKDEEEEEESVEQVMETELFGRLLEHFDRQEKHSYRRSYAQEVGSSFDPDMEDIEEWEQHLTADVLGVSTPQLRTPTTRPKYNYRPANANVTSRSLPQVPSTPTPLPIPPNTKSSTAVSNSTSRSIPATPSSTQEDEEEHEIPYDLDDMTSEELEDYAREYERQAVMAEFDGVPEEELFGGLSDLEDDVVGPDGRLAGGRDDDMDVA